MRNYEETLFRYIDSTVRYMKIQPLVLGGVAGSGGGIPGNPGGYIGFLPQTRVAYDESEIATLATPSGASLLDNLNHIRYRMETLEATTSGGVNVLEDGSTIQLGTRNIDFRDVFDITVVDSDEVRVGLRTDGVLSDTVYSGVAGEQFTVVTSGTNTEYTVANTFDTNSLAVYLNGLRQDESDITVLPGNKFTLAGVVYSGDVVSIDYNVPHSGYFHSHSQYLTSGDSYTKAETTAFLATKANLVHTHLEEDILDLVHDAVSIQGVPVASGIAPTNYQTIQFSEVTNKFEVVTAEFEQQVLFSIGEQDALSQTGIQPYRVYIHDVGANAQLTKVFAYVRTAPTTDFEFRVLKNGTTTATVFIGAGDNTGFTTTFVDNTVEEDDYLEINIVDGDLTAEYLTVHVRFVRRF